MFTPANYDCDECGKRARTELVFCDFCEAPLDSERCARLHECLGHDAESVLCVSCNAECETSKDKLGHETRPALIGGDPVCAKCAYFKPWEKKEFEVKRPHFEKAS